MLHENPLTKTLGIAERCLIALVLVGIILVHGLRLLVDTLRRDRETQADKLCRAQENSTLL